MKPPNTLGNMLQSIKTEKDNMQNIYKSFDFKRHRGLRSTKMSETIGGANGSYLSKMRTMTASVQVPAGKMKHLRMSTEDNENRSLNFMSE